MLFKTITGSTYEVDETSKQIRRISNANGREATVRQGDNQWKLYVDISSIKIGSTVFIIWDKAFTPLLAGSPEHATPITETSQVIEIC